MGSSGKEDGGKQVGEGGERRKKGKRKRDGKDGGEKGGKRTGRPSENTVEGKAGQEMVSSKEKLYGNYVGYKKRRLGGEKDVDDRMEVMKDDWFRGKHVVDIGCNDGAVLIELARKLGIKSAIGVDIDESLVLKARHSLRKFANEFKNGNQRIPSGVSEPTLKGGWVPLSFRLVGRKEPEAAPAEKDRFPFNVRFICEDVTKEDAETMGKENCDVILLLSVTKWIHLHGGDKLLKSLFRKIFSCLRPSGILILEPQPFHTYKRKIKLHPDLKANYSRIRLKPEKFVNYLLKVGFESHQVLREQQPKGSRFNRPIYLLRKPADPES